MLKYKKTDQKSTGQEKPQLLSKKKRVGQALSFLVEV